MKPLVLPRQFWRAGLVARQALRFCASRIACEANASTIERSFVSDIGSQPVQRTPRASRWPELSIVVPVHNEADNLALLVERLRTVLTGEVASWEVVFVDDGSRDETLAVIRDLNAADPRISAVSFSRHFGKEIAIAAGLDHALGDAVIIMDADLQHPPETIPAFLARWREGYLNVFGQRTDREGETRLKRGFAKMFYRIFGYFGETPLPEGAGDFRLLDRKAVDALRALPEYSERGSTKGWCAPWSNYCLISSGRFSCCFLPRR